MALSSSVEEDQAGTALQTGCSGIATVPATRPRAIELRPSVDACPQNTNVPAGRKRNTLAACVCLVLLLGAGVPLFLRTPLTMDTMYYDLQAGRLLDGGVLYRDFVEPNLPGIVWMHVAIRSALGWSSEAIRAVDLLLLAGIIGLLAMWVRRLGQRGAIRIWAVVVLAGFYLSTSEWCHCQRDTWMLLPALMALALRHRQMRRLAEAAAGSVRRGRGPGLWTRTAVSDDGDEAARAALRWSVLEGLCWGAAFWIKPHVALPAAACWVVSVLPVRRARLVLLDLSGLLSGGLLAGAVGVAWLVQSGTWPHFLEIVLEWNPEYVTTGRERWTGARLWRLCDRLFPWIFLHFVTVPLAATFLCRAIRGWWSGQCRAPSRGQYAAVFAAFYLGWLSAALVLQHLFDYVHVPALLLAITLAAGSLRWLHRLALCRPVLAGGLAAAMLVSPMVRPGRLACWWTCVAGPPTSALRDRLSGFTFPDRTDLDRVADFLKSRNLRDGELTCYNNSAIALYRDLDIEPATRYPFPRELMVLFPDRTPEILRELKASRQRYVVTDPMLCGVRLEDVDALGRDESDVQIAGLAKFLRAEMPWDYPIVFRAGRYLVHEVPGK